jgi:replicative DNA helicase
MTAGNLAWADRWEGKARTKLLSTRTEIGAGGVVSTRLEAIVAKQRNGPIGTVPLFYDVPSNAIRDVAPASVASQGGGRA